MHRSGYGKWICRRAPQLAGVSEAVGEKAFNFDRKQRRKGMVYAAENSLRAGEADPRTKMAADAYTEGINAYIATLSYRRYPLEYKLMGFAPEPWTNLKTSLLLKYMADDLTGSTDDIALTYLRDVLPPAMFNMLFPEKIEGSTPVIPAGTAFDKPSLIIPTAPADSVAFPHYSITDFGERREMGKGSNNWALSGSRTASGAAILCNLLTCQPLNLQRPQCPRILNIIVILFICVWQKQQRVILPFRPVR